MKTVSAISTPKGVGAVSMIRLTGDDTAEIAERVFTPKGKLSLKERPDRTAIYGTFKDENGAFDDGIVTLYTAPRSYTGESMAELMCHGGILATSRLFAATLAAGASAAGPGEFTRRAFINGKLTLSQAEAVGLLIEAKTDACLSIGLKQLGGALSKGISRCSEKLLRLASSVYAYIDYPDEDLSDLDTAELREGLCEVLSELERLKQSYRYGKAVSEGVRCAIVGCPNTGKSSVLNMLAGEERAIVTSRAGTTRDVVTETVRVGDILLRLADTAGIRSAVGEIERLGIKKSIDSLNDAELVLAVFDGSKPQKDADREIVALIERAGKTGCAVGIVNKADKGKSCSYDLPFRSVRLSALTGEGKDALAAEIAAKYDGMTLDSGETLISARQHAAISKGARAVSDAIAALDSGYTQDVAGLDIENALAALGELDGRLVSEDIVNEIFSRFCVGK